MSYASINLESLQSDVKTRLKANTYLASIPLMIENDPAYTADDINKAEGRFEGALNQSGIVLVVLSPKAMPPRESADFSHVIFDTLVPVAIIENPAINLSSTGLQKTPLRCVREAMASLISEYRFDRPPFDRPDFLQGLHAYYLMPSHIQTITAP